MKLLAARLLTTSPRAALLVCIRPDKLLMSTFTSPIAFERGYA